MKRLHGYGTALVVLIGTACFGGPRYRPPETPSLPLRAPSAPSAPSPVAAQRAPGDERRLTTVRPPDDLRPRTIAVALRGPEALLTRAWPVLARRLLEARFTRVLPPPITSLRGSVQSERGAARTTVEGDLQSLLHLRADTPAEVLLVVELAASAEAHEATVTFPQGALETYETAYGRFLAEVNQQRERVRGEVASWSDGARAAEMQYAQQGGRWQDEGDVAAREQGRAFLSRAQAYDGQLETALRAAVPPAELVRRAAAQRAASRASVSLVRLRATLTDLTPGQTSWMLELAGEQPDEAAALADVLGRLVTELPTGGPAPVAATEGAAP